MPVVVSVAVVSVMYELLKLTEKLLISKGISMEELEGDWGDESPLFLVFWRPVHARAHRFFHYTILSAICQEKSAEKVVQIFFPKFVQFATCILLADVVYYKSSRGVADKTRSKTLSGA